MASSNPAVSPFTKVVVNAVRRLYPEKLADSSFDNTGLLLEAPYRPGLNQNSVLLTTDLTRAVADEAIRRRDSIVVTYHPIIFQALKSFTLANSQQNSLLRLAQEGISVYCPHTAVDAAPEGLNDWLADIVVGKATGPFPDPSTPAEAHQRQPVQLAKDAPPGFEGAGYGRIIHLKKAVPLSTLITRIKTGLGVTGLSIAVPQSTPSGSKSSIPICSIGLCAGSGGPMLRNLDVDLLFTGELSHHEALACIERGTSVITAFHSNTERKFLRDVMQHKLAPVVKEELESTMGAAVKLYVGLQASKDYEFWKEHGQGFDVAISEADRDPFEIVRGDEGPW